MVANVDGNNFALERVLKDCLTHCLKNYAQLNLVSETNPDGDSDFAHIMLTISGVDARFVVVLHHLRNSALAELYCYLMSSSPNAQTADEALAFCRELSNQICGDLKRHLHNQFQHLGMSTPMDLSITTSLKELIDEQCQAQSAVFMSRENRRVIGVSVYVYSAGPILLQNLHSGDSNSGDIVSGELEFF
jgi:CheY-specific phosphatase CheX